MPQINICRQHAMDREQACNTVRKIADEMVRQHDVQCQWHGDTLTFSRRGLDGAIEVHDDHVTVLADLGLGLMPFKGLLTRQVELLLRDHFPDSPHC